MQLVYISATHKSIDPRLILTLTSDEKTKKDE